jgi:Universal stress protein UspA and related nucleotide-binding proteins
MRGQSYQHILAAIDLGSNNDIVLRKAIALARTHAAKLSVIHVDMDVQSLYTDMIDIELEQVQDNMLQETQAKLEQALAGLDFPIDKKLILCGDLGEKVNEAIELYGIDLLVCGHHQSFWSLLVSSARQLMNSVECDMLVVPIKK